MSKNKKKKEIDLDKIIDFGKQLFASVLRSRTGAMTELAKILRFQTGTKGFERKYNKLLPIRNKLKEAYKQKVLDELSGEGLCLGIFDDTGIKKTGKTFPEEKFQHDHTTNTFYRGMKVFSSSVYRKGKLAAVSSFIVKKGENKLEIAKNQIDLLLSDFLIDVFLFDSWYCKEPVLKHIQEKGRLFISRARRNTKSVFDQNLVRLDALAKNMLHKSFEHVIINGKSYWIVDIILELEAFGTLRVVISKEGVYDEPIFLITNAHNFSAKFVVKLYLRRFSIEVFFKDIKQFLNFETFLCRKSEKWDLHLLLTNVLHWAIQKKKSISKTIRKLRENLNRCLLFINQNLLIEKLFEELRRKCLT